MNSNCGSDFEVLDWALLQEYTWMNETGRHKAKSSNNVSKSVTCGFIGYFSWFYRDLEAGMLMFKFFCWILSRPALPVHRTNLELLHLKILSNSMETIRWEWRDNIFVSNLFCSSSLPGLGCQQSVQHSLLKNIILKLQLMVTKPQSIKFCDFKLSRKIGLFHLWWNDVWE